MPELQTLRKQLRGVRSTQKLASAMKTTSIVKLSKLNGIYGQYSEYGDQCKKLLERYGSVYLEAFRETDAAAPAAVIVLASNKGLCGSFNSDIFNFAMEVVLIALASFWVERTPRSCFLNVCTSGIIRPSPHRRETRP